MKFLRKSLHVRHPPIPNHSDHRSRLTAQTSSFSSVGCVGPGASLNMCSHTPKLLISHILYIYIYIVYITNMFFFRSGHGGGWVFTIYRRSYVLSYLESTLWMRSIYCSQFMDAMGTKKNLRVFFGSDLERNIQHLLNRSQTIRTCKTTTSSSPKGSNVPRGPPLARRRMVPASCCVGLGVMIPHPRQGMSRPINH